VEPRGCNRRQSADEHHAQVRGRQQQRQSRRDAGGPDHRETRGIMMAGLNIDIFNTGYRPVPSAIPVWPDDRQATWPATTSTLISGERDGARLQRADQRLLLLDRRRDRATGTAPSLWRWSEPVGGFSRWRRSSPRCAARGRGDPCRGESGPGFPWSRCSETRRVGRRPPHRVPEVVR